MYLILICAILSKGAVLLRDSDYESAIEMSSVHLYETSTYTFRLETSVALSAEDYLFIEFPTDYESVVSTSCTLTVSGVSTSCVYLITSYTLRVTLPSSIPGSSKYSLAFDGVQNPQVSEITAPFQLYTQTPGDIGYSSENRVFATLAFGGKLPITGKTVVTVDTLYTGFESTVSATTSYLFQMDITIDLDSGTWFRFKFPSGWSKDLGTDTNCSASTFLASQSVPSGSFYCYTEGSYTYFRGLSQDILVASGDPDFAIVITQVTNPSTQQSANAEKIEIDIVDQGTLLILDQLEANTPAITSGTISTFAATTRQAYAGVVLSNTFSVYATFTLPHSLQTGSIIELSILNFSFNFNSYYSCFVASGLSASTGDEAVPCATTASQITISGFQATTENTEVRVLVMVSASSGSNAIISVNSKYLGTIVDSGTFNVLSLDSSLNAFNALTVTLPGTVNTSGALSVSINPTQALSPGSIVQVSFDPYFTISSPTCTMTANGGTGTHTVTCTYDSALQIVRVTTATDTMPSGADSTISISTVTVPEMETNSEDLHEICVNALLSGQSVFHSTGCKNELVLKSTLNSNNFISGESNNPDTYMPYTLSFDPGFAISFEHCYVKYYLSTQNAGNKEGFALDLGVSGSPSCVFSSVSSGECTITNASSLGSTVTLELSDLGKLSGLGTARLMMKSPKEPSASFTYSIELGFFMSGLYKVVGSLTNTVATLPSTVTAWTANSYVTRSVLTINQATSIEFSMQSPSSVLANWKLYIIFPVDWELTDAINSDISYSTKEVLNNSYAPSVVFTLNAGAISNSGLTSITISDLNNPGAVGLGTSVAYTAGLVGSSNALEAFGTSTNSIVDSTAETIVSYGITPDPSEQGHPAVSFAFTFTLVTSLDASSKIRLTFPSTLGLSNYECSFSFTGTCSQSSFEIIISGIDATSAGSVLTITILRVSTPSTATVTGFAIESLRSDDKVIDQITGLSLTFLDTFQTGNLGIQSIEFDPPNKKAQNADAFIKLKPVHSVPKNSILQVTVPFDFDQVENTNCEVDYAVMACSAQGHIISVTMLSVIAKDSEVTISVPSAFTIPDIDQTGSFAASIVYNSVTLDETTSGVTFSPEAEAGSLSIETIEFYPRNQGEKATYHFSLSAGIEISNDYTIAIWFPEELDPSLTTESGNIECWAVPAEFVGDQLGCVVSSFRKLEVTGHESIEANLPIDLYVGGIANPTKGKLSNFKLAVQTSNRTAILYEHNAGNLYVTESPLALRLVSISLQSNFARIKNTFTIDFSPVSTIPGDSEKGRIWIDLPEDFVLKNLETSAGWTYPCSSYLITNFVVSTTSWAPVQCINYDSNRIEVKGLIEYTPSASTTIRLIIEELPGPQSSSTTKPLSIKTYDGNSNVVIDSTFTQVSYPLTFTLPLQGEEITVNAGNTITVRRGTCSSEVLITTSLMRVFLYLTASTPKVSEARLHPDNVLLWDISEPSLAFQISVPVTTTPGTYNLEWTKTGDDYDSGVSGDEIYAELGVSRIEVTSTVSTINISSVTEVADSGQSLPIIISLEYAPHTELYVTPVLLTNSTGLVFSPSFVQFGSAEQEKEIIIEASDSTVEINHEIQWKIEGEDASAYSQPSNSLFSIVSRENTAPEISLITITSGQYSVSVKARLSEESTLYYQLEIYGKSTPAASDILNSYDLGQAKRLNIYGDGGTLSFSESGLAAETNYVLFAVCIDKSDNVSEVYVKTFKTSDDHKSVEFVVDFNEFNPILSPPSTTYIESSFKIEFAKALAVFPTRLSFIGNATASSRLLSTSLYSSNAIIVRLANDKYSTMDSPITIVNGLTVSSLNTYLTHANITATMISNSHTLPNSRPNWQETGRVWDSTEEMIQASGVLEEDGYIHMVILDPGSRTPTAQQVVWGVDSENLEAKSASVYVQAGVRGYANYTGLPSDTEYDVYIAASSAYPGNTKAVTWDANAYLSVHTELGENCNDCSLYYVVNSSVNLILSALIYLLI